MVYWIGVLRSLILILTVPKVKLHETILILYLYLVVVIMHSRRSTLEKVSLKNSLFNFLFAL